MVPQANFGSGSRARSYPNWLAITCHQSGQLSFRESDPGAKIWEHDIRVPDSKLAKHSWKLVAVILESDCIATLLDPDHPWQFIIFDKVAPHPRIPLLIRVPAIYQITIASAFLWTGGNQSSSPFVSLSICLPQVCDYPFEHRFFFGSPKWHAGIPRVDPVSGGRRSR